MKYFWDKSIAGLEELLALINALIFAPLLCLILFLLTLATCGISVGIRRRYVNSLLRIFEWGRKEIDDARKQELLYEAVEEDSDVSCDEDRSKGGTSGSSPRHPVPNNRKVSFVPVGEDPDEFQNRFEPLIIKREANIRVLSKLRNKLSADSVKGSSVLRTAEDTFDFIKAGVEAVIEDDVTNRFEAEELACWNLLTRTSYGYHFANWKLGLLWLCGFAWRYFFLFPTRLILFGVGLLWLVLCTFALGYIPEGDTKRWLNQRVSLTCYRILSRAALSAIITYHNEENMAQSGGICVANHTSPIDILMLACNNCYALVGQKHGGLLGIMQRAQNRASSHIWFERSEATDRAAVAKRLRDHVSDENKLPILIFPEGTCINNTSVMMFKKGSFEVGGKIYPAAIKYDPRFGDPFWNSSKQAWMQYLIRMMSSWAIVCDVWYLPPMERKEGEDGISFANRVKKKIAKAGGLVDLEWDGQLKRYSVPDSLKEQTKELYAKWMEKSALNTCTVPGNKAAREKTQ